MKKKDQIAAKEVWSKYKYNEAGVKDELDDKERKLFYFWNRNRKGEKRQEEIKGTSKNREGKDTERKRVHRSTEGYIWREYINCSGCLL